MRDVLRNRQIRASRVILIDEAGQRMGEFIRDDAISLARDRGLDLVQVDNDREKPVCKLLDYGKMLYDKKKKQQKSQSSVIKIKELKLRPNTDIHDFVTRVDQARKFLQKGNKVKVCVEFRGRENAHLNIVEAKCLQFAEALQDVAVQEGKLILSATKRGRRMTMFLVARK